MLHYSDSEPLANNNDYSFYWSSYKALTCSTLSRSLALLPTTAIFLPAASIDKSIKVTTSAHFLKGKKKDWFQQCVILIPSPNYPGWGHRMPMCGWNPSVDSIPWLNFLPLKHSLLITIPGLLSLYSYRGKEIRNKHVGWEMVGSALRKDLSRVKKIRRRDFIWVVRKGLWVVVFGHGPEEREERARHT